MTNFLRKLVFSDIPMEKLGHNVLYHQWQNLDDIWNNQGKGKSNAIGTERLLKMTLIFSQFLSPSIYFRALFGSFGKLWKHVGVEIYVFFKLTIAYLILTHKWYTTSYTILGHNIFTWWCMWMIMETILYILNLIFSRDIFAKPHSYTRNLIFIIVDYVILNLDFATLYLVTKTIKNSSNKIIDGQLDAAYFSFISSITIGYGDITAANDLGKQLIIFHSMIFLIFGVVFINFYTSKLDR